MIYRADLSSINYIVSSKNSCIHEKMHESKKEGSSYILIDYFDWLTYVSRSNDLVKIDNAIQFKYYFNKCENLIKVLNSRLNSDNMLYIASLLQKERVLEGEESLSILDLLCRGYLLFEKEMWDLQIFLQYLLQY